MIALYFLTSLVCYAGIFYFSYFKENLSLTINIFILILINCVISGFWAYLTNKLAQEKETLITISLLNGAIVFFAYNVAPHIFLKLKIEYTIFTIGLVVVIFGFYLITKSIYR